MDIKNILIDKISPSPINPRKSFDGAACPDEKSGDVININDAYKMKAWFHFDKQLTTMASNESFKQAIKAYLDKRAEEDSLFAPKYANEKKSIDECCSYIMGEARKRGNAVAISDEEVYGMAVHYYDEDDIKINRLPAGEKTSVSSSAKPVELTEEDKKAARDKAIARLAEEQYQTLRKKNVRKKADDNAQQMSLF